MPIELGNIRLFSVNEISQMLNVTPITLRTYIKNGKLTAQKVGVKWYVTEESLRDFFNSKGKESNLEERL